jgi:hypothetical protein
LAGHGLVEAAKAEGWAEIACHIYDGPYPEAFLAIDNRASDLAEDDDAALVELLKDLNAEQQLPAAGWSEEELAELLESTKVETGEEIVEDEPPEPPKVAVTRPGDIWLLGRVVQCPRCRRLTDV